MRKYLLLLLFLILVLSNIVSFQETLPPPSGIISFKDSLKIKDPCSLEDAFDQRKFNQFFAIDTILDSSFNTKLFEKLSTTQLYELMCISLGDGSGLSRNQRINFLRFLMRKNIPDAFAEFSNYQSYFHPCKAILYMRKALILKSKFAYKLLTDYYMSNQKYMKGFRNDSTASELGSGWASYKLYKVYSTGSWDWDGIKTLKGNPFGNFINKQKAQYYYQRAIEQEYEYALLDEVKNNQTLSREKKFSYLVKAMYAFSLSNYAGGQQMILDDYYFYRDYKNEWEDYKKHKGEILFGNLKKYFPPEK